MVDDFDPAQLPWCDAARGNVSVNRAKFRNLEMAEVIVDAMPFLLTHLTAEETGRKLTVEPCDRLFGNLSLTGESAIGVVPGDNLASARHMPEVNRRLLLLGKWIGESLNATAAAWMPSRNLVGFGWFDNAVKQYLTEGRFPAPFHISFSEVRADQVATNGLRYFTGQEIDLHVPPHCGPNEISDRVQQISAELVAHGRIEQSSRSGDMAREEMLIYTPSDDLKQVEILIRRDANNRVAAERK